MGAIGKSITAYAQPLVDQAKGSPEKIEKALGLAMICWNMSILPDAEHDEFLADMQKTLKMDDKTFREFRRDLIDPMIRRHREMFPEMDPTRRQWIRNTKRVP
jgi:hypothetical protein